MSIEPASLPRRLFVAAYLVPAALLLAAVVWPLASAGRTLFLRDVLNTHYEMKLAQAEAMREGRVPLVDAWRSGGQAHLGNPNTSALYPDNLLLLVASPLWVLNARFWLHWLLAPLAFALLGRAWGIGREAAFAGGICYASCGFFLSNLNLHNLVAGVTLAPAFVAAALGLATGRRPGAWLTASALLWALLLLGGDPMTGGIALLLALGALVVRYGRKLAGSAWLRLASGLALGSLIAAPQLVEFARILPHTFRGHWGYSEAVASSASLHPASLLEGLLPLFYGAPDLNFWGARFFTDGSPLYYSLFPGALALALVAASGAERHRAFVWAWLAVGVGLFFAVSNPLARALLELGGGLARLPVKLVLASAMGGSLLCALGFERLLVGRGRRAFAWALAALGGLYLVWLSVAASSGTGPPLIEALLPGEPSAAAVGLERSRWLALASISLALVLVLGLLAWLAGRRPAIGGWLLAAHLGGQLLLLAPLFVSDETAVYARPPAALAAIPPGSSAVQGEADELFGRDPVRPADYPDPRLYRLERRLYRTLTPFALVRWGRRAELAPSPEGLDLFVSRAAAQAVGRMEDAERLRMLAASGVEYLVLSRPLAPAAEALVEPVWRERVEGAPLTVYRVKGAAPPVRFAGTILRAPYLNDALRRIVDPSFDPAREVVLAGAGAEPRGSVGRLLDVAEGAERLALRVEATGPGAVVWQRAPLPIYRARVDGQPAPIVIADLHRLAVEVAAGTHAVEVEVDRGSLTASTAVAFGALLALVGLSWRLGWKTAPEGVSSADFE